MSITSESMARLPVAITRGLAAVRRKKRGVRVIADVHRGIALLGAWVVLTLVMDRWLLDLPAAGRAVLLAVLAAGVVLEGSRFLYRAFAPQRSLENAALLVEQAHPELKEQMISAVQLSGSNDPEFCSPELVEEVVRDAERKAAELQFGRAVRWKGYRRYFAAGWGLALLVGSIAWAHPGLAGIWMDRMLLLADTPWPKEVELYVRLPGEDVTVVKGDEFLLEVEVRRGEPKAVMVHAWFDATGSWESTPMVSYGGSVYRRPFENVSEPFRFYVSGGDDRTSTYRVKLALRPAVERIELQVKPPAYTGLPEQALASGDVEAPEGSKVAFLLRTTTPVTTARMLLAEEAPADLVRGEDDRSFRGGFEVKESAEYGFELTDAEGRSNASAGRYRIKAIPDQAPNVRIAEPGRDIEATRGARVAVKVAAHDDYGVSLMRLRWGVLHPGQEEGELSAVSRDLAVTAGREVQAESVLELEGMSLAENDRVVYWAEADDLRPQIGMSRRYIVRVVSSERIRRALDDALVRVKEELKRVHRQQEGAVQESSALRQLASDKTELDTDGKRRLLAAELDQRRIGQRLVSASEELGRIVRERESNKVSEAGETAWLGGIRDEVGSLGKDEVPVVLAELQAARNAAKVYEAMADVPENQDRIARKLADIIRRLVQWSDVNEILRELKDLKTRQQFIREQTDLKNPHKRQ